MSEKLSASLSFEKEYVIKDMLSFMVKDKEIIRRLLITLGILVILRFVLLIPLYGIDFGELDSPQFRENVPINLTIFSLGLMPFFSSCLLIQLATIFINRLKELSFGGEDGREKISRYTYILTIIISIIYSYFISMSLGKLSIIGTTQNTMSSLGFKVITIFTITASVLFLLFVADLITRYGIGNGIAVITVSSITLKIFTGAYRILVYEKLQFSSLILSISISAGLIYIIFKITNCFTKIEIQDKNLNKTSIHLKSNIIGDGPIEYTKTIIFIFTLIGSTFNFTYITLTEGSVMYIITSAILIFICTYFYTSIIFDSKYICNMMNKYEFSLVDVDINKDKNGGGVS